MLKDQTKDNIIDFALIKTPAIKYLPIVPLMMVGDVNRGLENYYKRHNIKDTDIKNTMRHITGAGQSTRTYGPNVTRMFESAKESVDFWTNNRDNLTDINNNDLGIKYVLNNPKTTREELMDFAFEEALRQKIKKKNLAEALRE